MTKRDYELLAATLTACLADPGYGPLERLAVWDAVLKLTTAFESANPRFNADTFLSACKYPIGSSLHSFA